MSALNWDSTKFQDRAIGTLILAVQIKVLSEEFHNRLFLKIHLTENLKIADVGYGIGSKILRVKFEKMKNISEELWAGWWKLPIQVVSEDNNFTVFGIRPFLVRVRSTIRHNVFLWQKSNGDKLFQVIFSYCGGDPVADCWCFWRHDEQKDKLKGKRYAGSIWWWN